MTQGRRLWRAAGLASALALSGAGLVGAQPQGEGDDTAPAVAPAARPVISPVVRRLAPPVAVNPATPADQAQAPPAADTDTADADDAASDDSDKGSAASSKPGPAKPVDPAKRPRYAIAVLQALDKVSAETIRFEAPINQPIRYKSLIFIVRACETTAPDEPVRDAIAHVEIISQPKGPEDQAPPPAKRVFRGWMFANAPGLNLFQHPVYDAWLIACKTAAPST